CQHYYDKPLTF
nr:immunoglobulin light chain junction region [Macaca mulatta]MOX48137.1 immunoglobulin light chain junction region [Macaca mulatta]MOX48204.1 immunoglobulin light chain junction region [Macaca mulatta]MOX48380.1 immunoglobulin light chain junction region [Macaca mulatta]MOX48846.1 immunoglobulin light chain junction region [Macaca mulatta]